MAKSWSRRHLRRACLEVVSFEQDDLVGLLGRVAGSEGALQGVAYTTSQAFAVTKVVLGAAPALRYLADGALREVPLGTVYELRLWRVTADLEAADGGLLACEWRWLNGTGAVQVTLREAAGGDGGAGTTPCWFRPNAYLQHGATLPSKSPQKMDSIEVFQEHEYGNTVFVDELMTGKWGA